MSDRSMPPQPLFKPGEAPPLQTLSNRIIERKRYIAGLLELLCQELELPETKRSAAESAYNSVGTWLNDCSRLREFRPVIFVQGSVALGTTVKPLSREDFDVDLICHLSVGNESLSQAAVKKAVGGRLMSSKTYAPMLAEYRRCWRLDYSAQTQLHLDITPSVNNSKCGNGGLCVTDREARAWQSSHPKAYVEWFHRHGLRRPKFRTAPILNHDQVQAHVAPFPEHTPLKGLLRRTVQLLKRHRCIRFQDRPEVAPISVILTTLAAKAYAEAALSDQAYDTELDLVCDVIVRMPRFIERRWLSPRLEWWIPNETTEGENFAEKWNRNPALPEAFSEWHAAAKEDFYALSAISTPEQTFAQLEAMAGSRPVAAVRNRVTETITAARTKQVLRAAPAGTLGLTMGIPVRGNTFFGA